MKKIFFITLSALFLMSTMLINTPPAHAITETKEKDIKHLLKMLATPVFDQIGSMGVAEIISQEKERYPDLPEHVEYALTDAIHKLEIEHLQELENMMVPVYDKYYTHHDIKELIKFYSSPIGRKHLAVSGAITQDMIPKVQTWGKKAGAIKAKRAGQVLRKYGYK